MTPVIVRGHQPGAIGRIVELHAAYYARQSGFGLAFEAKVARELAEFLERHDPARDGVWLAMVDGRVEGSVVIDGLHAATEGAHLRWFIASDALRGSGTGHKLLGAALAFCDACRYSRTYLWTFAGLNQARHLYEKHGFGLVHQERGSQWGAEVDEQRFERPLPGTAAAAAG